MRGRVSIDYALFSGIPACRKVSHSYVPVWKTDCMDEQPDDVGQERERIGAVNGKWVTKLHTVELGSNNYTEMLVTLRRLWTDSVLRRYCVL